MLDLYGLEILHNVQSLSDMVRLHDRRLDRLDPTESSFGLLRYAAMMFSHLPFGIPSWQPRLVSSHFSSHLCWLEPQWITVESGLQK